MPLPEPLRPPGAGGSTRQRRRGGLSVPPTPLEQIIAETWTEVLPQPPLDADSNFFALGGHSLLAMQCVSRLRERIPVALSLSDFFENATVAQQAALVQAALHDGEFVLWWIGCGQGKELRQQLRRP